MTLPFRHRVLDRSLATLLICLLFSSVAAARSSDRDQALDVRAGGLDGPISQDGDTVLTDVTIIQGSLKIDALRATVSRSDGEVTRVLLEGSPASLQQENDSGQMMKANAKLIDYDTNSESILLTGSVLINQGRDEFRGERVRYDTRQGRILGEGGSDGRIQLTIHPKPRKTAD